MESTNQQATESTGQVNYAGFGKRFAAMVIDSVIVIFFCAPLQNQFYKYTSWYLKRSVKFGSSDYEIKMKMFDKIDNLSFICFMLFVAIATWCYYAGMESSPWRATLGKKLLGLEVTDEDGDRISFIQASGRYFGKILSGMILYFGYFAMLVSPTKQTWHDGMSGCIVKEK